MIDKFLFRYNRLDLDFFCAKKILQYNQNVSNSSKHMHACMKPSFATCLLDPYWRIWYINYIPKYPWMSVKTINMCQLPKLRATPSSAGGLSFNHILMWRQTIKDMPQYGFHFDKATMSGIFKILLTQALEMHIKQLLKFFIIFSELDIYWDSPKFNISAIKFIYLLSIN